MTMFKLLLKQLGFGFFLLVSAPISHAQAENLPMDLIELLGELDDGELDDEDALNAVLTEIEVKNSKKSTKLNEVKK